MQVCKEVSQASTKATSENCSGTFELHRHRIEHLINTHSINLHHKETVIVIVNAADPNGKHVSSFIKPGRDMSTQKNDTTYHALADKILVQELLANFNEAAAVKLAGQRQLVAVVVDYGTVEIFTP